MNKITIPFLFLLPMLIVSKPEKAICVVPVADLLSAKIQPNKKRTILEAYKNIPASVTIKKGASSDNINECGRALQLLYNEQVTILAQEDEQCYIETPYWNLMPLNRKNNRFWTLASNLRPINLIGPEERKGLPAKKNDKLTSTFTMTLKDFFYCPETKLTYLAGTRFSIKGRMTNGDFKILIYDPVLKQLITSRVPGQIGIREDNPIFDLDNRFSTYRRSAFLKTVRGWTDSLEKIIPYVLGGASAGERLSTKNITPQKKTQKYVDLYTLSSYPYYPYQGLDCSSLVRCACQIAGIPLYAINTSSIASTLNKLPLNDYPENGDLIYWKGHIAIISDIQKGLLIEARGYDHGYGFVHEIPFNQELQGIQTTNDLVTAYRKKRKINRIDKWGQKRETITDLTILKLPV